MLHILFTYFWLKNAFIIIEDTVTFFCTYLKEKNFITYTVDALNGTHIVQPFSEFKIINFENYANITQKLTLAHI